MYLAHPSAAGNIQRVLPQVGGHTVQSSSITSSYHDVIQIGLQQAGAGFLAVLSSCKARKQQKGTRAHREQPRDCSLTSLSSNSAPCASATGAHGGVAA
jgi:hypothetical protein